MRAITSRTWLAGLISGLTMGGGALAAQPRQLIITAPDTGSPAGPAWFKFDKPLEVPPVVVSGRPELGKEHMALRAPDGSPAVAQKDDQGRWWLWLPELQQGQAITYDLEPAQGTGEFGPIEVKQVKEGLISVTIGDKPFTSFQFAKDLPRPFLYPVIGPTGDPVTRDYPMQDNPLERENTPKPGSYPQEHHHHRSIWTAHGDVRTKDFSKEGSNYWLDEKDPGRQDRQVVQRISRMVSGLVFGQIEAQIDWVNDSGQRELSETRGYTFFAGGEQRIIDVRVSFHFLDGDVMFADTKEGGIVALRTAVTMCEKGVEKPQKLHGQMTNSRGGVGAEQCWGKPAEWCDYVGPVNGKTVGIAIFDAPTNFRHPTRWHIRDYGLYTANPFGLRHFTEDKAQDGSKIWKKGEHAEFNYRILIHQGDTKAAGIAQRYQLFAQPPKITVK